MRGGDTLLNKKYLVMCLLTSCFTATLLVGVTSSVEYDPWMDTNDDGLIDIVDIVNLAIRFGEEGTPINKTTLLLELQDRIDSLNGTLETRIPRKGSVSVPAAAFTSQNTTSDWRNYGTSLQNHEISGNATFYAGVQLPHGATVTNLTSYYTDLVLDTIYCVLYRYNYTDGGIAGWTMASVSSIGEAGTSFNYDDSIDFATVDNDQYTYYLYVTVPPVPCAFHYAVIEYEYQ